MGRDAVRAGCAAVAVVVALGAAACTGQGDGGGVRTPSPTATATVRPVVLPEPAPASKRWIVDQLVAFGSGSSSCPVPTLANTIVLDDDGHDRADAVWLADDSLLCVASITRGADSPTGEVRSGSVEAFTAERKAEFLGAPEWFSFFAVFPGDAGRVVITGDSAHGLGPVHQRVVDLGGGRTVTLVQYAFVHDLAVGDEPRVCPGVGMVPCREAGF